MVRLLLCSCGIERRFTEFSSHQQVLAADLDLLNPPADYEKRKHKLKRLVQSPNSFFMDVKCQARRKRDVFFFPTWQSTLRYKGACGMHSDEALLTVAAAFS